MCNGEFEELVPRVSEFDGKGVTFISLSIAGWSSGELPSTQFLKEWKTKHAIPFVVAASPKDAGKMFYTSPRIPNTVIVDREGKLAFKGINPGADRILDEVRRLLP